MQWHFHPEFKWKLISTHFSKPQHIKIIKSKVIFFFTKMNTVLKGDYIIEYFFYSYNAFIFKKISFLLTDNIII